MLINVQVNIMLLSFFENDASQGHFLMEANFACNSISTVEYQTNLCNKISSKGNLQIYQECLFQDMLLFPRGNKYSHARLKANGGYG